MFLPLRFWIHLACLHIPARLISGPETLFIKSYKPVLQEEAMLNSVPVSQEMD